MPSFETASGLLAPDPKDQPDQGLRMMGSREGPQDIRLTEERTSLLWEMRLSGHFVKTSSKSCLTR
jgi:hypothetical protein